MWKPLEHALVGENRKNLRELDHRLPYNSSTHVFGSLSFATIWPVPTPQPILNQTFGCRERAGNRSLGHWTTQAEARTPHKFIILNAKSCRGQLEDDHCDHWRPRGHLQMERDGTQNHPIRTCLIKWKTAHIIFGLVSLKSTCLNPCEGWIV